MNLFKQILALLRRIPAFLPKRANPSPQWRPLGPQSCHLFLRSLSISRSVYFKSTANLPFAFPDATMESHSSFKTHFDTLHYWRTQRRPLAPFNQRPDGCPNGIRPATGRLANWPVRKKSLPNKIYYKCRNWLSGRWTCQVLIEMLNSQREVEREREWLPGRKCISASSNSTGRPWGPGSASPIGISNATTIGSVEFNGG